MSILTSKLGSYPPHTKQKLALDLIQILDWYESFKSALDNTMC
jgi:hypothetical protein